MVYVARFTLNPQADIERGWSGWMGIGWNSVAEAARSQLVNGEPNLDQDDIDGKSDDELLSMLDDYGFDVRYDEAAKLYRLVHHDGLSCFRLEAQSVNDALLESHPDAIGDGDYTIGYVRYCAPVPGDDGWHIFECSDTARE